MFTLKAYNLTLLNISAFCLKSLLWNFWKKYKYCIIPRPFLLHSTVTSMIDLVTSFSRITKKNNFWCLKLLKCKIFSLPNWELLVMYQNCKPKWKLPSHQIICFALNQFKLPLKSANISSLNTADFLSQEIPQNYKLHLKFMLFYMIVFTDVMENIIILHWWIYLPH